jgi:hypothetical protein
MNWKEFQPKTRYRKTITNTFLSEQDCDMFIMVLKQQWPSYISELPQAKLEITKSIEKPNTMQAIWTLKDASHLRKLNALGQKIIKPYRDKLSPKVLDVDSESLCIIEC